jgi:hypothetical protein
MSDIFKIISVLRLVLYVRSFLTNTLEDQGLLFTYHFYNIPIISYSNNNKYLKIKK